MGSRLLAEREYSLHDANRRPPPRSLSPAGPGNRYRRRYRCARICVSGAQHSSALALASCLTKRRNFSGVFGSVSGQNIQKDPPHTHSESPSLRQQHANRLNTMKVKLLVTADVVRPKAFARKWRRALYEAVRSRSYRRQSSRLGCSCDATKIVCEFLFLLGGCSGSSISFIFTSA
jgi:hypothetical protein